VRIIAACILALTLAACASAQQQVAAPVQPITCNKGPDCDAKWSRAVSWVTTNSSYKVQTQTDSIIQTMGPLPDDPSPAYSVTKVATTPTTYELTFNGGCDNIIGCIPTMAESRARFAAFVNVPGSSDAPPSGQASNLVWMRTDHRRIEGNPKLEQQDAADRTKCNTEAKAKAPNDQAALDLAFKVCRERDGYVIVTRDEAVQLIR
jgi:hypothetical protein